jgi:conjugative coupling factor TraD (TOL family)
MIYRQYPIENLLRPPVELLSAALCVGFAVLILNAPGWLLLDKMVGQVLSLTFLGWGLLRAKQGWRVLRYQKNLRHLQRYALRANEIPWSKHRLFLGKGFVWDSRHTQRLMMLRRQENKRYTAVSWFYQTARALEQRLEHTPLEPITALLRSQSLLNPVRPMPEVGGDPALHGVEPNETDIWQDLGERVGHTLVLGTTRVGKTRLLELLVTQDIRRGDVVIVFDPKGDAQLLRRMYAEAVRSGREKEFYFFHLGYPRISARYNPIGDFERITEVATRIANQMPSEGQSSAFKQFVWRFVNTIVRADVAVGNRPSYARLYRFAENIEPLVYAYVEHWLDSSAESKGWRAEIQKPEFEVDEKKIDRALKSRSVDLVQLIEFVRKKEYYDPVASSLMGVVQYEGSYFQKLVASLYPFLEKVTTGEVAELFSPEYVEAGDPRPTFTWESVIESGGIVYCGFAALIDTAVATAVANSMLSDLTSRAGKIYNTGFGHGHAKAGIKRSVQIHGDELAELIGDDFIPLINKGGGAGYNVTGYTQARADAVVRFNNLHKAMQAEGNFNTRIFLRVLGQESAELLTKSLPEVEIPMLVPASGVNDANDPTDFAEFSSRTEDKIVREKGPMLSPADLISLPKGQAFVHMNGGRLYKVRLPLADPTGDTLMPPDLESVAREMQHTTAKGGGSQRPLTVEGRGAGF